MAYVTGVMLLILVFVAMPVKYLDALGQDDTMVQIVGTAHGWLYMVYLISAFILARQGRWDLPRTILVLLAGTVPFASFFAERRVVRWAQQGMAHQNAA